MVFYRNENVGYHYKYWEPVAQSTYQPRYHWEFVEWEDCSVRCGGGTQIAQPVCLEEKAGKVTPTYCDQAEKPEPKTRKCHEEPCKTKWRIGKWGPCNACRYKSGVRIREVDCVRESQVAGKEDVLIDDKNCAGPRPGTRELCTSNRKCPTKREVEIDGLLPDKMRKLWFQTFRDFTDYPSEIFKESNFTSQTAQRMLRDIRRFKRNQDKSGCNRTENSKTTLNVGTVVEDKIPPEEIKLIAVPLKQSHLCLNISDNSFETMGDLTADTLDEAHKKEYTGNEAAEKLKTFAHKNASYEDHS